MNQPLPQYPKNQLPTKNQPANPTKHGIVDWISSLIRDYHHKVTIEQLGDGEIYCRIINHFAPGTILPNRIVFSPKNQYEYMLNLKQFQNALSKLKISIYFDIQKVSKQKFNENWALISHLYKHLQQQQVKKGEEELKKEPAENSNHSLKTIPLEPSQKINHIEVPHPVFEAKTLHQPPFDFFYDYPRGSLLFTIDRVKEIILSNTHDTEKMRLIKVLFGLESAVKVEDNELNSSNSIRFV